MFDDKFIESVVNMSTHSNCDSTVNHIVNIEESKCKKDYNKYGKLLSSNHHKSSKSKLQDLNESLQMSIQS